MYVELDIRTDVRKYLLCRYSADGDEIKLDLRNLLGAVFRGHLTKIGYLHTFAAVKEPKGIRFGFSGSSMRNMYLLTQDVKPLKSSLYKMYREELKATCECFEAVGKSDYSAVKYFMEKYGLTEDDVSSDNLRKKYRDWKEWQRKKIERKLVG
jgi:hypothetical protein